MPILLLIAAVGLVVLAALRSARDEADAAWLAEPMPSSSQEGGVVERYMRRHRRHRRAGALIGLTIAVVAGVRWYGEVTIGIGRNSPLADLLFCGLAGTLVGTLSAETFRLSEPRNDVTTASLAARTDVVPRPLIVLARGLVLASIVIGAAVLAVDGDADALSIAVIGTAVAGVAEATRRAITSRRRPVSTDRARWLDDRMRWFAQRTVGNLQLSAAWLVAGWVLSRTGDTDSTALEAVRVVVVIGCLVAAVVHLRRAAPRRPRDWVPAT